MYKYFTAAFLAVTACASAPVHAQIENCVPTKDLHKVMEDQGAEMVFAGLNKDETGIIEVWTHSNGRWKIFISIASGLSCFVDEGFQFFGPKPNA